MNLRNLCYISFIALVLSAGSSGQTKNKQVEYGSNIAEFVLSYDFLASQETKRVKFRVVLPRTLPDRQKILDIKYSPEPTRVFHENSNRYAEFNFVKPRKTFKIKITIKAELSGYDLASARKKYPRNLYKGPGFKQYLMHEVYIEKDDPQIQKIAQTITAQSDVNIVRNIYKYVIKNIEYTGFNKKDLGAAHAARLKNGDCTEYADLFVALCRAKGVPARAVSGYITKFHQTAKHSWAEAYLEKYGWVPFDPAIGDIEGRSAQIEMFNKLEPIYIYFSRIRNDDVINFYPYSAWWYWGSEVSVEDSIKFIQPSGNNTE